MVFVPDIEKRFKTPIERKKISLQMISYDYSPVDKVKKKNNKSLY